MKFHPYSEVFPLLEGAAFDELVADIKANGLREKIWLYDGKVIDGRNRFLACQRAKVQPEFRNYTGKDPLAFVISLNVARRHLTAAQLSMAAARIATLRDGQRSDEVSGVSIETAARATGASVASTKRARQVVEKGSAALQRAVDSGDIAVSRAAAVVDLPKSEQLAAAQKAPEPKPVEVAPEPEYDFSSYEPEDDEAYKANIENVMMADDKLAAMREELKQCHREIQTLKASRNHYQNEAGAAVRLVKARDREIARLKKQLESPRAA